MRRLLLPVMLLGLNCVLLAAEKNEIPAGLMETLEKAETLTLFSVSPGVFPGDDEKAVAAAPSIHGYQILGKVAVTKADERKKLLDALKGTLQRGPDFSSAKCFQPRHGIRAEHGGKTVDVLICFQCSNGYVYDGAGKHAKESFLYISNHARDIFNKMLTDAGVKLAPGAEAKK